MSFIIIKLLDCTKELQSQIISLQRNLISKNSEISRLQSLLEDQKSKLHNLSESKDKEKQFMQNEFNAQIQHMRNEYNEVSFLFKILLVYASEVQPS